MADTVYCYSKSEVLVNLLDERDGDLLQKKERQLTALRLLELLKQPIPGNFDFAHLKTIHRYVFQDIYPWAGKVRAVDIAKGNMFCKVELIGNEAERIFGQLLFEADTFATLGRLELAQRLAYYLGEINALHPFGLDCQYSNCSNFPVSYASVRLFPTVRNKFPRSLPLMSSNPMFM